MHVLSDAEREAVYPHQMRVATAEDGFGTEADSDADWEDYRRNPYAVWDTYILAWGEDGGETVGAGDATPQGGDTVLDRLPTRLHAEENYSYSRGYLYEDGWAWKLFPESTAQGEYQISASLAPPIAGTQFRMRLGFDATRNQPGPPTSPGRLTPSRRRPASDSRRSGRRSGAGPGRSCRPRPRGTGGGFARPPD